MSTTTKLILIVGLPLIAYLAYQQFAPAPTTTTRHQMTSTQTVLADGILPEDLNAHFDRYSGGKRDPFVPGVFPPNSGGQGDLSSVGKRGGWSLTGINQTNGVASALVENDSTGDSVFLQAGDHWNGLKVLSIGDDAVTLENDFGQQTQLSFPAVPDDSSATPAAPSAIPALSQISPLPPLGAADTSGANLGAQPAIAPQAGFGGGYGGFGGGRGRRGFGAPSN